MAIETILDLLRTNARIDAPLKAIEAEIKELEEKRIPSWLGIPLRDELLSLASSGGWVGGDQSYGGLIRTMGALLSEHTMLADRDNPGGDRDLFAIYVHDMARIVFLVNTLLGKRQDLEVAKQKLEDRRSRIRKWRHRFGWPLRAIPALRRNSYKALALIAMIVAAVAAVILVIIELVY